ncbi:MAG: PHP domain-containing protein [Bdellovibrionota bacterium]
MWLADFHMHSTFSDGKLTIPELVDLYGARGFGAIAITDHLCEAKTVIGKAALYLNRTLTAANFPLYLEILKSEAERAWKQYGMVVLPGFELTKNSVSNHRSAHIIGIGVTDFIHAEADAVHLIRAIKGHGGIAIAAHPVATGKVEKQTYHLWGRRQELAGEFDAWEVASGQILFDEVLKSGLPLIANSDLHRRNQLSSWKTQLDCERHPEAILDAIRKQRVNFKYYHEVGFYDLRSLDAACDLGTGAEPGPVRQLVVQEAL